MKAMVFFILLLPFSMVLSLRAAELTPHQQLGRDLFKALIETDTTHSTGDTTKAAELLARRFRDTGFPEADVQIIGPTLRNKNLVVRYRGTGLKPPVVLLAHLDVVEAKREDWSLDPFKLTEKDGFFYGRGTSDIKDGVTGLSAALLRLRRENFKPNRDLILALTSGEEGGADYNGAEWLLTNRHELVKAAFCLNADSGGPQMRHGKKLMYSVQAAEKIYQSFRLEVKGSGGHSSVPTKDNPIYHLAAGLLRLSQFEFPARLGEITRRYFQTMSQIETGQTAADMKAILKTPPDSKALKELSAVPFYNAILRTTAVATMLQAGHAENALPQMARATVNCRLLRTSRLKKLRRLCDAYWPTIRFPSRPSKQPSRARPRRSRQKSCEQSSNRKREYGRGSPSSPSWKPAPPTAFFSASRARRPTGSVGLPGTSTTSVPTAKMNAWVCRISTMDWNSSIN